MEIVDGFLDGADAAAEVGSFEARGDGDEALQIFAANFGFAGRLRDGGKRSEGGGLAGTADEERVVHALERGTISLGKADADGVRAIIAHDRCGGGRTFQNGECVGADFVRRKSRACGNDGIDLIGNGRAADGVVDAVENVHDAVYFADGFGDARRGFVQKLSVFGEKFDDDGFGLACKIADHVGKQLDEFDLGCGFFGCDLFAEIGDDVVNGAAALGLELDGEVATIRFGDGGEAELEPRAAGSCFDFGSGAQNFFDVLENAVGFGERTAWRSEVVEDEAAFVHCGQQIGFQEAVGNVGQHDDYERACKEKHGTLDDGLHDANVEIHGPAEDAGRMFLSRGIFSGVKRFV